MFPKKKPKPESQNYTNDRSINLKAVEGVSVVEKPRQNRFTGLKRGKKLKAQGRNVLGILKRAWNAEWKRDFVHVQHCESCGQPDGPGFAKLTQMHALKQRFITTREGCRRSAKVCWGEHRKFDFATGENVHEKMRDFVDGLIAKREI